MASPTTPARLPGEPIPPPPEPHYPWKVGAVMVGLVALVVAVVWLAFQLLKGPSTAAEYPAAPTLTVYAQYFGATATVAEAAHRTAVAQQPGTQQPVQPTSAPAPVPTAAPAATPEVATTVPAAAPQPVTTTEPAAPTSAPEPEARQATGQGAVATPVPTVDPELAAEVSAAYARYWQVVADADWSNDPSGLDQVAAGKQLATLRNNIAEDQSLGRATRVRVQHSYVILSVHSDRAELADHIQDLSVYVDPTTHELLPGEVEPSAAETAPTTDATFQLQLLDGTWKVIGAARIEGGS